jgi:hypothetical protein
VYTKTGLFVSNDTQGEGGRSIIFHISLERTVAYFREIIFSFFLFQKLFPFI